MAEPTLYLFDGYNLLYAGPLGERPQLVDLLASFLSLRGARGVVVFDGVGEETTVGSLEVRFAPHADELLERLAREWHASEAVCLISSDRTVRRTAGLEVRHRSSAGFLRGLLAEPSASAVGGSSRSQIEGALDEETRQRLEAWRRGGA